VGIMRRTNGHLQPLVAAVVSLFFFFLSLSTVCLGFNETAGDDSTKLSFFFPLVPGIHSDLVGVMEKLIDKFNDENPGIHVEDTYLGSYTDVHAKVVDLVEAGTPPDVAVLNVNAMVGLVQKSAIAPLTDYINKAGGRGFLDQFYSSLLVHEPVYGLPMMRSTPVLYVNTDLLKEAGIDSPPTTWQQLVDDYAPITNYFLDKDIHALAIPDTWTDWIFGAFSRQAGSQLIKNDWITATFNSEGNSEALNLWVELTNKGIVPSPLVPWSNAINLFVRGKVAMLYYTTGGISRIKSSPANFTWEAVFCPAGPAGYGVEEGGADLHIFNNIPKKNQDAAWKLITFLTSPEIAATWSAASGYIAVNKESYNTYIMESVVQETPAYLVARDQFQYAHPQMMSKNINEVRNVVNGNLNDALTGGKTVVEALEDGQAGLIRIISGGDLHQLGLIRIFGYVLWGLIIILSIILCAWTYLRRNKCVVMASQPFFLYMIVGGCVLFVSTILPLSIDDGIASVETCTKACRAVPWFLATGFTIVFSALYSKIRRLNIVLKSSKKFKRIRVKERDVLVQFGWLFGFNVILLILWTVLDPLYWKRSPVPGSDGRDSFGRCTSDGTAWIAILVLLCVANFIALVLANAEAYRASGLEIEFHESRYIAIATGLILQAVLIGVPLLVMTLSNQMAQYFVACALIFVVSSAVLLFIFVPKVIADHNNSMSSRSFSDGLRLSLGRMGSVPLVEMMQKVLHLKQLMEEKGIEETEELFREAELDQVQDMIESEMAAISTSDLRSKSVHRSSVGVRFGPNL